jgi:hypothetical protein
MKLDYNEPNIKEKKKLKKKTSNSSKPISVVGATLRAGAILLGVRRKN